ncbi:MAG TPA: formylmethanofuran dehydrogenase subunit C [Planctomycetaceae bacterium]|nr:formylmethanofuran dehydrogenase subunit C [Planctomycetaceae bacterium]
MPLVFSLRHKTSIPVEVDSIQLETVREQSLDDIRRTPVQYGNKQPAIAEFFDVSGSAADDEIVWEGDCSHVKLIGTRWKQGKIIVNGSAGMHLGAEMTGGEIVVHGNAADWVGAEMHGGRIRVHGNAGDLIGAAYRGSRRGMTGGEILIHGDAGDELGHNMRRGLIAVGGRSGDAIGFGMIAGSVLLFGETGIRPGAGMRRGTIGFLGDAGAPPMLPTFRVGGRLQPVFLRIYLLHLRRLGFPVPEVCFNAAYQRYHGDFLEQGRGEILVRLPA